MIREADRNDLQEILELYLFLHETDIPEETEQLKTTWDKIVNDENHHLIVCEIDGKIVGHPRRLPWKRVCHCLPELRQENCRGQQLL